MPTIIPIETPSLGDRTYLVHDGQVAFVIDPQRDIDRVVGLAEREEVRITHVFETHIHNDYVTGGLALAQELGAEYHVNGADEVAYERSPITDGDEIEVSATMTVRAIATPGHTFTHLSYAAVESGEVVAVFTGGSLLFGATGRPDLLGPDHTHELVREQYASAHRLADNLPDHASVMPTHGFGSFCAAGATSGSTSSTIGEEKRINPALNQDEQTWVSDILAGLEAFPAYYAHMGPANAAGPEAPNLSPPAIADQETIAKHIDAGDWVVDLRTRTAYAQGHVRGTFNIGVEGQFSTYLGWIMPWGTSLTLLGDTPEQVADAQRELVRIGIDHLDGSATGRPEDWSNDELATLPRATFADLAQVRHHRDVAVVDVRRPSEFDAAHIDGAINIPLNEILERRDDIPPGEVWVHCAGGYRASIAASVLATANDNVVLIDDGFDPNARDAGLPVVD